MTVPMLQVQWVDEFDPGTSNDIVGLVNSTVGDGGTLGYAQALSDDERMPWSQAFDTGSQAAIRMCCWVVSTAEPPSSSRLARCMG
jgi:hypothetical protein